MDIDDSLDFEFDDSPLLTTKRRKKLIGLDDLFFEHKKEQAKNKKGKLKTVKAQKVCESDDDDNNETENKLTEALHDFKKTICEVDGHDGALNDLEREDSTTSWGLQVFGTQRTSSPLAFPKLERCLLLKISLNNELDALLDHSSEKGETLFEGLLLNGWLSKLIIMRGFLEESIAKWTFNLLFYSSEDSLMESACDFWCSIMCNKIDASVIKADWLPRFLDLKRALECFGYQMHLSKDKSSPALKSVDCKGPPTHIRMWIKFLDACCKVRNKYSILSIQEAEEFIGILVCFFLDRQLLGLTGALQDCLLSAINFFKAEEWTSSCEKVAKMIADRLPRDLNCLRAVDCISGVDTRSKKFRSVLASQFLTSCYCEQQSSDEKDILKFLMSKNLKDKGCNLFKVYICLVLTENWLLFGAEPEPSISDLWSSFIRKCSVQISNTDFRPCAQEIRNRASYLLHSTIRE